MLIYIKSLGKTESLSDKLLTLKLTILLALTAASRGSEIALLDIRYMSRSEKTFSFAFTKLTKSWRKGQPPPSLSFRSYTEDDSLCVVEAGENLS